MTRYWMAVVSREHVRKAVEGGFFQANHGKEVPLQKIARGDRVVFYSPRESMRAGALIQAFTAVGEVIDDRPFRAVQSETFQPYRRTVKYAETFDAPIGPMVEKLSFSSGKQSWGQFLRRGFFEIDANDFAVISTAMKT